MSIDSSSLSLSLSLSLPSFSSTLSHLVANPKSPFLKQSIMDSSKPQKSSPMFNDESSPWLDPCIPLLPSLPFTESIDLANDYPSPSPPPSPPPPPPLDPYQAYCYAVWSSEAIVTSDSESEMNRDTVVEETNLGVSEEVKKEEDRCASPGYYEAFVKDYEQRMKEPPNPKSEESKKVDDHHLRALMEDYLPWILFTDLDPSESSSETQDIGNSMAQVDLLSFAAAHVTNNDTPSASKTRTSP